MDESDDDPPVEAAGVRRRTERGEAKTQDIGKDGTHWVPLGEMLQRLTQETPPGMDVWAGAVTTPREGTHPKSKAASSPQMEQALKQRKKEGGAGKNQD